MNDFDYDVLQKKRVAAGARHRVNGSKSKYCALPSDRLSAAELKKRNGECRSYKLDEPIGWDQFRAMPDDLKKEYLKRLRDLYAPTDKMLGEMFHISTSSITSVRKELGICGTYDRYGKTTEARRPSAETVAKWNAFCNGVVGGKAREDRPVPPCAECETDSVGEPEAQAEEKKAPRETPAPAMEVRRQVMELEGTVTAESLAKALARLTLPGERCRIRIEVETL